MLDAERVKKIEEMIDKYVKKKINFQIDYDHEGNPIFKGKNRGMKNESI